MNVSQTTRVLLVEDEPTISSLERDALEQSGFSVQEVNEGLSALETLAASDGFELLVLDYRLPDMTAADIVAALGEKIDRLPVVVITGYPDPEIERTMRDAGVADYLIKDIGMSFLERLPKAAQSAVASYSA